MGRNKDIPPNSVIPDSNLLDGVIPEFPDMSLLDLISTSDVGINLIKELQGQYSNDLVFKDIINKPKEFWNFEIDDNLIYLKEFDKNLLCIPHILINGRSVQEIIISEAHSMLTHLGASKTHDYLRDHIWWKSMVPNTKALCETCVTCKRRKPNNQKPYKSCRTLGVHRNRFHWTFSRIA